AIIGAAHSERGARYTNLPYCSARERLKRTRTRPAIDKGTPMGKRQAAASLPSAAPQSRHGAQQGSSPAARKFALCEAQGFVVHPTDYQKTLAALEAAFSVHDGGGLPAEILRAPESNRAVPHGRHGTRDATAWRMHSSDLASGSLRQSRPDRSVPQPRDR